MIKINLVKNKRGASIKIWGLDLTKLLGEGFRSKDGGSNDKFSQLKNSPIIKVIVIVLCSYLIDDFISQMKQDNLKAYDTKITEVQNKIQSINSEVSKIKGYEPKKKQLEEDEQSIRTKYEIITQLLEHRNSPSKMLVHLAENIPDDVWLMEMKVTDEHISFYGGTYGFAQVSDFIKSLNESKYFSEVSLKEVSEGAQMLDSNKLMNQDFQKFEVQAKRSVHL